jgi:NAD(P)-dependent dehydrogenase (short-subunit alcohol dehydrogenase family)
MLLCLELFPLLRSTAAIRGSPTRITFVGSATQIKQESMSRAAIPPSDSILDYFDDKASFGIRRYADSKLAASAYTRRLAELAPSEVIVNNLCPGLVQTGLDKNLPGVLRVIMGFVRKSAARTVQEGGRTLIHAAVVAGQETNGKFLRNNRVDP